MGRIVGVFGTAGFAREVMPLVRRQLAESHPDDDLVFVSPTVEAPVNGVQVIDEKEFLASKDERAFTVAIADGRIRRKLFDRAVESGAQPLEVRAASAEVFDAVTLGPGAILCGHSSVTSNTRVGIGFHLNISSYLAHDCVIGDFVTFGPNVVCAGNVIVEDGAYIGGGAMIRQGRPGQPVVIGAGAVVGMGAVVTKSVSPGATVIGNPARAIVKG
ncbi:acetyltransferase [Martelella soudanensis]|uniref:acetyltransferase n=1 Tax=unclassified Martelella TaxID=2629616 RepID=UPI0015DFF7F3|nr:MULTISPECIES: acetyltransferase [unclassified Martelella]